MNLKMLLVAVLTLVVTGLHAQDKIYVRGEKKPREVKVVEIGPNEIKVQDYNNDFTQVYETADIVKIVFENGNVQSFERAGTENLDRYRDMKINAFKLDLLSIAFNSLMVSYERVLRPGFSYEIDGGMVGLGKDVEIWNDYNTNTTYYDKPSGFRFLAGVKATKLPDYVTGRLRYRHVMQGSYVKPYLGFESVSRNFLVLKADPVTGQTAYSTKRGQLNAFLFGLNLGRSWVMSERLMVDTYFGIGYSASNYDKIRTETNSENYYPDYTDYRGYGYTRLQPRQGTSLTLTGGVKLGYVFNWNKDNDVDVFK